MNATVINLLQSRIEAHGAKITEFRRCAVSPNNSLATIMEMKMGPALIAEFSLKLLGAVRARINSGMHEGHAIREIMAALTERLITREQLISANSMAPAFVWAADHDAIVGVLEDLQQMLDALHGEEQNAAS